jgi:outer membrane protein assembly factor BamB
LSRVNARLFAFRRDNGDLLWSRDFENMTLEPQPGTWPFFFITADGEEDEANRGKAPSLAYVIDRATGKTLHAVEYSLTAGQRGWKVDAVTGAVSLKAGGVGMQVSQRADTDPPPPPLAIPGS